MALKSLPGCVKGNLTKPGLLSLTIENGTMMVNALFFKETMEGVFFRVS
jgi:hypothetical protein